ncbi:Beta-carotene hydroxylase [Crocosphaera watsonii WH 8502]|uniref:Beta-carotene hydroxylase n=4 Tax=Crocosphaera watsonii TaxID=263511 RepID=T2JZJ8_CROWT|nr:Beta-carotene hydroxylase [Crocosphaera watsonii WH 8502]CCQ54197.1 Beta-carotene hydroxylase [Crocosphaera watsonii WH 0005]CCQ61959.1 Beta-carotene hydroxylase [Crocosphaera watsonii WH 0401]CCQ70539.1 Beta-carotene hydroxylase [Crocosphaera watsonii WH 0402]
MRLSLFLLTYRPVVRAIMDLIRSVGLGISVLGFISPPGYF